MLNQAIFHSLYVDDDQITDHNLREPFGRLHTIQQAATQCNTAHPATNTKPEKTSTAASLSEDNPTPPDGIGFLLQSVGLALCSSKPPRVGLLTRYSNRSDVLHKLWPLAIRQLEQASSDEPDSRSVRSVRSYDRKGRIWGLAERLSEDNVRKIALSYEAGELRCDIAAGTRSA